LRSSDHISNFLEIKELPNHGKVGRGGLQPSSAPLNLLDNLLAMLIKTIKIYMVKLILRSPGAVILVGIDI